MDIKKEHIVIVQYTGDFREAAIRLARTGKENYRGQRYTVDYVEGLSARYSVTTIAGMTADQYDTVLPSGARAIGAGFTTRFHVPTIVRLIKKIKADRIILRLPNPLLLRWAAKSKMPTLALLADSFPGSSLRERLKRSMVIHYLRSENITLVANHGRTATRQLIELGVPAKKVVAWDFPAQDMPHQRKAKGFSENRKLLFAGMLSAEKGVDDLLRAAAILNDQGKPISVDLYGQGEVDRLKQLAKYLKIHERVAFKGLISNDQMVSTMAEADIVIVPSRHQYSEGLPLTIYEALCSRTPLIASDHPMFMESIKDRFSCLMFPAGNTAELAEKIETLLTDQKTYSMLSANSIKAWEDIQIPTKWSDVIERWLDDK